MFVVDGDEFENTVLSDDRDDSLPARLVVHVYERDTSRTSLKHASASFIEWSRGVYRYRFDGGCADGLFDVLSSRQYVYKDRAIL